MGEGRKGRTAGIRTWERGLRGEGKGTGKAWGGKDKGLRLEVDGGGGGGEGASREDKRGEGVQIIIYAKLGQGPFFTTSAPLPRLTPTPSAPPSSVASHAWEFTTQEGCDYPI